MPGGPNRAKAGLMHRSNPFRYTRSIVGTRARSIAWDIEAERRHATRVREGSNCRRPGDVVLSNGPEMI